METKKTKSKDLLEDWQDTKNVIGHYGFLFVSEIIWSKLNGRHHKNLLASHFNIHTSCELEVKK